MKKLILVASPPACGKTYVSEMIAKSVEHIVYLDKDDLGDLLRASFAASEEKVDMDGEFYAKNLRAAEYSTILNIAFSALRFEDVVLLNAPFVREVRDEKYMKCLKERANENNAELILIWVTASVDTCYERMKSRNSDRDGEKLKNWEEYVKKITFAPPYELESDSAVNKMIIFDNNDEMSFEHSLADVVKMISEK